MSAISSKPICSGCFSENPKVGYCPVCGHCDGDAPFTLALKTGAMLDGHFVIGKVLGKPGGFGITYLAWDNTLQTRVAIKEFLPQELAGRGRDGMVVAPHSVEAQQVFQDGLRSFLLEARTLARFNHPNIVRVRHYFQANGTAYMVMDYCPGLSLWEHIQKRQQPLGEAEALAIILPVLDGLRSVHEQGFVHRDIKPQNIYLAEDGRPILLDFGTARNAMSGKTHGLSLLWTPGFAPLEQCQSHGKQGPWTDVYGLTATLYYMVSGLVPEAATEATNLPDLPPLAGVSGKTQRAIRQGLASRWQDRPQNMQAFRELLGDTHANKPLISTNPKQDLAAKSSPDIRSTEPNSNSASPGWCVAFYVGWAYLLYTLAKAVAMSPPDEFAESDAESFAAVVASILVLSTMAGAYVSLRIGRKFAIGSFLGFSVPIYNFVLLCRCAGISPWLILLNVIPFGGLVFPVWLYGAIARRLGKSFWLNGLGFWLVIPILIMAFDDSAPGTRLPIEGDFQVDDDKVPAPISPRVTVEFVSGQFQGEQVEIPAEGLVIGRNPAKSNLVVNDEAVSGKHLRITVLSDADGVWVEDLASTNGSFYRFGAASEAWQTLHGSLHVGAGEIVWLRLAENGPILRIY